MTEILTRSATLELAEDDWTVSGIAVPFNTPTSVGGYREQIARGAIEPGEVKLFWLHNEVIGRVVEQEEREGGYWIKAKISDTTQGRDARTLMQDAAVSNFSIGFIPVEDHQEEDGLITRTKIQLLEVSAVPMPAYPDAKIHEVRSDHKQKEKNMDEAVAELRTSVEELARSVALMDSEEPREPVLLTRSFGELVKGVASGDEAITRAYEGAATSDAVLKDAWLGSLVEVLKAKQVVANTFARGAVPATGMSVEYAVLKSNTIQVGKQAAEGDDLAFGKVSIETKNATIGTFGGYSSLSRQVIERSDVGILDTTFTALAEAAYTRVEAEARATFNAGVAAAATMTGDLTSQDGVVALILNLAEMYDELGLSFDGLFLDKASFLSLYGVDAEDRILQVTGQPADKVGNISVTTASGSVAGVPVRLLPGAAAGTIVAYDSSAIKTLQSGMPRLQADNVVNLTRDFSTYLYATSFVQRPEGLIKVNA